MADRRGPTTTFALLNLQERGSLFVGPGVEVYEGMVVGENARAEDLDVNATKEKKLTNVRSSTADELVRLIPPRPLSLEQALEFIRDDECVEVTPASIRLQEGRAVGVEATAGLEPKGARPRLSLPVKQVRRSRILRLDPRLRRGRSRKASPAAPHRAVGPSLCSAHEDRRGGTADLAARADRPDGDRVATRPVGDRRPERERS